jgi:ectoine hydroxylase-related dioxygenase (phytanoyl-CoA dioxygenase family)
VVPGFLIPSDLPRIRKAVEAEERAPVLPGCERPHNRLVPLRWNSRVVDLILENHTRRRMIRDVASAEDLRWISGYVSIKEPSTPPLWWHQDWWCWDHPVSLRSAAPQVALLIYLSPTNERSGALRVLPGSHRSSVPLHRRLPEAHAQDAPVSLEHPALADHPDQVTLGLRPGDAVMIDYRLLHGTHPNSSAARRDSVLLSFAPAWRGLPNDLQSHLIQHLALPRNDESVSSTSWRAELLPSYEGIRADLELNRVPPNDFMIRG